MLARLRPTLDFMRSPLEDKPGLLIRDPFRFTDATLIVPMGLLACLEFFDGAHTELDLREFLFKATGQLDTGEIAGHLRETLSSAGFLEDGTFGRLRAEAEKSFATAPVREPAHAGNAYPAEPGELNATFAGYMRNGLPKPVRAEKVRGIAAPHVSPFGGVEAYRAAYSCLSPEDASRTFVILGTSHYGEPDTLGLTRKPFVTPLGEASTDQALAN